MGNNQHNTGSAIAFDPSLYPQDFFESRTRFRTLAQSLGAQLFSYPVGSKTPNLKEPLSIDIALLGSPSAKHKILHIAGTHGVEAFVGSAIQCTILQSLQSAPRDYAIACVHCLNPWGMAMIRRGNESNVDLNRNCIFDPRERTGAPNGYDQVRSLVNPTASSSFHAFSLRALVKVVQHGFVTVRQAITGGQYVDPQGIFYGGQEVQPEIEIFKDWLEEHISADDRVIAIDLHSGLGSFCKDALLLDALEQSDEHTRVTSIFESETIHAPNSSQSLTYTTRGSLSHVIPRCHPGILADQVVHEFGTLHPFKVLHALIEENYHYFHSPTNRPTQLLLDAFCPQSITWRMNAVQRGLEVFNKAARACAT
jgi:hypothetical protein